MCVGWAQAVRLHLDLSNPTEAVRKLRALPQISHVYFFAPGAAGSVSDAASALQSGLESFHRLVSAVQSAGCSLRFTQFTSGDDSRGERSNEPLIIFRILMNPTNICKPCVRRARLTRPRVHHHMFQFESWSKGAGAGWKLIVS